MKLGKLLKAVGMLGIIGGALLAAILATLWSPVGGLEVGVACSGLGFVAFLVGRCFD